MFLHFCLCVDVCLYVRVHFHVGYDGMFNNASCLFLTCFVDLDLFQVDISKGRHTCAQTEKSLYTLFVCVCVCVCVRMCHASS